MGQRGGRARPDGLSTLDAAYRFAQANQMPFQMHVMVWGNQQPEWIKTLRPAEQRREIEQWFAAVAQRYPDIALLEVVNEPLNDPPSKADTGGGNYLQALGATATAAGNGCCNRFGLRAGISAHQVDDQRLQHHQ